jgi:cobalamin-dependent methionine synthase I
MANPTVVTGTVGRDAHVIGTKILSRALRVAGFNVVELGILTLPGFICRGRHPHELDVRMGKTMCGIKKHASRLE